ncbi:hypothetical protein Nepgr_000996 [Nepenthes gracilis]|uniref:Myb-related protein 123 n=1 Tax=Nepenthes gracilis TaxID=150966 RepID=A0AAD3P4K4_NEPGR|nr:hypothetical protein Nepgr_000996 [Nepenthes gracilis]
MGRSPCCSKEGLNRGAWTATEDRTLTAYINANGEGGWRSLPKRAGLKRCGKSCRLRWLNYLRPDIKRGNISHDEEDLIIRLHNLLGNRWSLIAGRLPGRTDNEIKNYWNTTLIKKLRAQRSPPQAEHKAISMIGTPASNGEHKTTDPPPSAQATGSQHHAIRTRAIRCTRAIVEPPLPPPPPPQNLQTGGELIEYAGPQISNNVANCDGQEAPSINGDYPATGHVPLEEMNETTMESWLESNYLAESAALDLESLTSLLEEWA